MRYHQQYVDVERCLKMSGENRSSFFPPPPGCFDQLRGRLFLAVKSPGTKSWRSHYDPINIPLISH
jgi:hypothetical protein